MYEDKEISKLYGLMPVFLAGLALAGLYTNLEETKWIENLAKKRIYNLSLTIISLQSKNKSIYQSIHKN